MSAWARGLAIADGRIPDGVDPDSPEGRRYAALIEHVKSDVAAAPRMTAAQKAVVMTLLRSGAPPEDPSGPAGGRTGPIERAGTARTKGKARTGRVQRPTGGARR